VRRTHKYLAIAASVALGLSVAGFAISRARDDAQPVSALSVGDQDQAQQAENSAAGGSTATEPSPSTPSLTTPPVTKSPAAKAAKPKPAKAKVAARQPVNRTCSKPVFKTSDTDGGWDTNGYYVHNNMWNASEGGPETLYACAYNNWYVTSTQPNSTSVKTYPNVHKDYDEVPIRSFKSITSTFAATSPHVGIYNVAYDIWTNGVADDNSTEFMIWTENYKQVPAGSKVTKVTFGGRTYDVWKTSDNKYIAFVPKAVTTSGSLDLLQFFNWTISKGWLPANSTLGQIDYGVEICSTNNRPATFHFTDFSITSRRA
jgi:Glycosyl hydrolase family 12